MVAMSVTLDGIADKIRTGDHDEARQALDGVEETEENRLELMFLRGYLQELSYDREGALAAYQTVVERDPEHTEAVFRAALLCDQLGDDGAAVELYERCVTTEPAHVNALLNLAVLYEEQEELPNAEACLKEVLSEYPNHRRARHFLKSVESSYTMVYDEQTLRERERRSAILDVPISDFELSVRSRNCLRQMNIRTLGDLLKATEAELLSYKNFGETSLTEIKAMLNQQGLRLGLALRSAGQSALRPAPLVSGDASGQLDRPVSELELSVRARKCLQRLGVSTIGELTMRMETELMTIKNFGQTSLGEIKRQLAKYGLSLRQPEG